MVRIAFRLMICSGFYSGILAFGHSQMSSDFPESAPTAWERVESATRDLDFLEGLADYVLEADVDRLSEAIGHMQSLSGPRKRVAHPMLIKAFLEADEDKCVGYFSRNWETLRQDIQEAWLYELYRRDSDKTIAMVFSQDRYQPNQGTVIHWLALENPTEAVRYLDQVVDQGAHQAMGREIADALVMNDPESAIEWVHCFEGKERKTFIGTLLDQLARKNSIRAAEFLQTLSVQELPNMRAWEGILSEWTLREPKKARAWAEALPDGTTRDGSLLRINAILGKIDPQLAVEQAMNTPEGILREELIARTAQSLCRQDLKGALAWLEALPKSEGKSKAFDLIGYMADKQDPVQVAEIAMAMAPGSDRNKFLDRVYYCWTQRDPVATYRWAIVQDERALGRMRDNNFRHLVYYAPEKAIELILEEGVPAKDKDLIFDKLLSCYGTTHPSLIKPAVDALMAGSGGMDVNRYNLKTLVKQAPEEAIRLAVESAEPVTEKQLSALFSEWAEQDPSAAAAYAAEIERLNEGFPVPYRTITEEWARRDLQAAQSWVASLPEGKNKTIAQYDLEASAAYLHPEKSFHALASIEKPEQSGVRLYALRRVVEEWACRDPAKARQGIESSGLSESDKQFLLDNLHRGGMRL